jgi:hypothetical protein
MKWEAFNVSLSGFILIKQKDPVKNQSCSSDLIAWIVQDGRYTGWLTWISSRLLGIRINLSDDLFPVQLAEKS